MEDGFSRIKILGIDVVIPATPIPVIHIQSIASLPQVTNELKNLSNLPPAESYRQNSKPMINLTMNGQDELPIGVCERSTEKVIELTLEGAHPQCCT